MIKAILACDEDWGIGKDGELPWPHNSADLKWFKENTTGGVVVMGKSTWDSLPFKPLPKRENIIVTRSNQDTGITNYQFKETKDIWIIGGAKLIEGLFDIITEFHLSKIKGIYDCDTYLPGKFIKEHYLLKQSSKLGDVSFDVWCKK